MPNLIITPKALAIIVLASAGQEVASFLTPLPEQLLVEAQSRAMNFAIQYGALAIGQSVAGSKFVDPVGPTKLFVEGLKELANASSPEEAAAKGSVAAAILLLSGLSSENPNYSNRISISTTREDISKEIL